MIEFGERRFLNIPGDKHHELPPLLVRSQPLQAPDLQEVESFLPDATRIIDDEDLIADQLRAPGQEQELERRRYDLAFALIEQYKQFLTSWLWGDSVLEWIRQCEMTFESKPDLRHLVNGAVWPRAGRFSFVTLLEDKRVVPEKEVLERSVGLRLTFRQPPPLACCSEQFLIYLNSQVGESAFRAWVNLNPPPVASLPPERFNFQVHVM